MFSTNLATNSQPFRLSTHKFPFSMTCLQTDTTEALVAWCPVQRILLKSMYDFLTWGRQTVKDSLSCCMQWAARLAWASLCSEICWLRPHPVSTSAGAAAPLCCRRKPNKPSTCPLTIGILPKKCGREKLRLNNCQQEILRKERFRGCLQIEIVGLGVSCEESYLVLQGTRQWKKKQQDSSWCKPLNVFVITNPIFWCLVSFRRGKWMPW